VVDGAPWLFPGGEEGGAGAAEPDPFAVPKGLAVRDRVLGLRAGTEATGAALRPLGRVSPGDEHAPRADAGRALARTAPRGCSTDPHDLGRRADGALGARALAVRLPAEPDHDPR